MGSQNKICHSGRTESSRCRPHATPYRIGHSVFRAFGSPDDKRDRSASEMLSSISQLCDYRWNLVPVSRDQPDLDRKKQLLLLRSEEHTSELQSRLHLVCRLLLEKKKQKQ